MTNKDELQKIINEFMKNASEDELKELNDLLNKRKYGMYGGRVDPQQMATNMADKIRQDIGLTQKNIKNTARQLVMDLALQYNPNISVDEIQAMLQQMVPEEVPLCKKVPGDLMLAMIEQFIQYSEGTMPHDVLATLPKGWHKKYWEAFSPRVQKSIAAYISKKISRDEMWKLIRLALKGGA